MNVHKKLLSLLLALCLILSLGTCAFAASYSGDNVQPGLSGILPGDSLTLPGNTIWANLTANWGVRVSFVDWDETELKTELVPISDTTPGSSHAPADPTRDGYAFIGWERHDKNNGSATLNDDGSVTDVNGPGPIVFIAKYKGVLPALNVTKVSNVASGEPVYLNQTIIYTVTVENSGNTTLSDITVSDSLDGAKLTDGESNTFASLEPGESVEVHYTYTVTEEDILKGSITNVAEAVGYDLFGTVLTPVSNENDCDVNTDPVNGKIEVTKKSDLAAGEKWKPGQTVTYTVTVNNVGNVTVSDIKVEDKLPGAKLADGESDTIASLAPGESVDVHYTYAVTEADVLAGTIYNNATVCGTDPEGNPVEGSGDVKDTTEPTVGSLTISKTVTGNLGDKTKYFTFKVNFDVDGTFSYTGSANGTVANGGTIQLKHGESVTITGIPAGAHYTVTESGNSGYSVYASGNTGIIADGMTAAAKFTNSKSSVPKTGDDSNLLLWLSLMGISVLGMAGTLLSGNIKRRKPNQLNNR